MLLKSKDDNLLLQMGGLFYTLLANSQKFLTQEIQDQVPELFVRTAPPEEP